MEEASEHQAWNERVQDFVAAYGRHGAQALIANAPVDMRMEKAGGLAFPVSVVDGWQRPRSYLVSPTSAYIDYAREEARLLPGASAAGAAIGLGRPLLAACGLDRQVQVNNWMLATNPLPGAAAAVLPDLFERLAREWPDHAIIMRSLNRTTDGVALDTLKALGCRLLAARQVYLLHPDARAGRDRRRDEALLRSTAYEIVSGTTFDTRDFERAATLYEMLYLERHSRLNPHYTPLFLREMQARGVIELTGLRGPDGRLDGVGGLFVSPEVVTQPIVGYDTSLSRTRGLYRMAMLLAVHAARDRNGSILNLSAGAAGFKRNRGARPEIEWTAVFDRHLSRRRRAATTLLATLLARVGVPIMKRHEL